MTYGATKSSAATRTEFQPPRYTAARSNSCSTTTSDGRSLVGLEPVSNVKPTRQDPLQSVSFAQRTCERLEVIPDFTGRNAADSQGSGSAATRAESQSSQYCESGASGYSASTYGDRSETSSSSNSSPGGNMMASTLGFGGKSEIFPPHYPMFVEIEPNNSLEESEQDFYRQRMIEYSQNLTDYREPKPITDTVVTNLTAER